MVTSLEEEDTRSVPSEFSLSQNYPNPFNPSTTIRYGLPNRSHVALTFYNTLGQQVAQLVNGEVEAGDHDVKFDACTLPSGMFFYRVRAGNFVKTCKLLMVREGHMSYVGEGRTSSPA